ncbi:unnamed protein product [Lupinus luteus]|uniref:Uncharacterized protein n=1 Tax=Lupinus luteus TaxID=3873 RepID=A0AAV1WFX5_LUPLU
MVVLGFHVSEMRKRIETIESKAKRKDREEISEYERKKKAIVTAIDENPRMVNFMLMITAKLDNLTNLQPQGGCDDANFSYLFKVKCGRCGELSQRQTCVALNDTVPLPFGKGTTHLIQKGQVESDLKTNLTNILGSG